MQCLCFDIETTGLDAARDDVTMVCCEDVATGERTTYNFGILCKRNESCDKLLQSLIRQFDEATCLCAFNGIRFDLPFLHQALQIHSDVITRWVMKTVDPLEFLRLSGHRTSSLDKICTHNHIDSKSSSGQHAVEMARRNACQTGYTHDAQCLYCTHTSNKRRHYHAYNDSAHCSQQHNYRLQHCR